jgi:DNA mismatch endonuclease (patch repair protein)
MMAGIRGRDTRPELAIRSGLHRLGFRFRLHARKLAGRPDIVLPKWRAAIFVHGCFWHGHECHLFKWPKSRTDFWREKICGNQLRDRASAERLLASGWRVFTIWECSMKGPQRIGEEAVLNQTVDWLRSDRQVGAVRGTDARS